MHTSSWPGPRPHLYRLGFSLCLYSVDTCSFFYLLLRTSSLSTVFLQFFQSLLLHSLFWSLVDTSPAYSSATRHNSIVLYTQSWRILTFSPYNNISGIPSAAVNRDYLFSLA